MTNQDTTERKRKAALKLLSTGLASPSEVSELSKESRQLVRHWFKTEGINWRKARRAYLAKMWRRFYHA